MKKGLVMEGGAMRGLFTAGVIDVLMENKIEFDGAVGVSAGAAFGCNFKSKQLGRALRYNMSYCGDKRYCSFRSWLTTGDLFGAEFCYHTLPDKLDIFDADTFFANPMEFYVVCTDVETGMPFYKKIEEHRRKHNLPEIANYEEIFQFLDIKNNIIRYNGKELILEDNNNSYPISKLSKDKIKSFFENAKIHNDISIKELQKENIAIQVKDKSQEYQVFLNIRHPLFHDYEGTHQGQGYKESQKNNFGYIAARQVHKAIKEGYDGVIYENLYDPYLANNYGVFNPNQIKSATDNIGTFNTNNPDIRYSVTESLEDYIEDIIDNGGNAIAETFGVTRVSNINDYINTFPLHEQPLIAKMLQNGELEWVCR